MEERKGREGERERTGGQGEADAGEDLVDVFGVVEVAEEHALPSELVAKAPILVVVRLQEVGQRSQQGASLLFA